MKPRVTAIDIDVKTGSTLGFYEYGDDKPEVFVLSGMHGDCATDVYTSYLLMKYLDGLERIDGSVSVLPVANPLAFRLGMRTSPLDSKDLDSVFPGSDTGTVTERLAREIWKRSTGADYVIHLCGSVSPCISHVVCMHRQYIHVRNLACQMALPLVVDAPPERGSLSVEAAHEGIPAISIIMRGGRENVEPQAAVEVREAIVNFLRTQDMVPGSRIDTSPVLMARQKPVYAEQEGFFVPVLNVGEVVSAGNVLGHVQETKPVVSPCDGAVVIMRALSYIFEGDLIAQVAPTLLEQRPQDEPGETSRPPVRRKW
ncbi:MAG: succinylglutamate desuccinylase/aspartoacylase family protein [Candidatus Thorarchaeota archaeon]